MHMLITSQKSIYFILYYSQSKNKESKLSVSEKDNNTLHTLYNLSKNKILTNTINSRKIFENIPTQTITTAGNIPKPHQKTLFTIPEKPKKPTAIFVPTIGVDTALITRSLL